jgi:hypothetical protein
MRPVIRVTAQKGQRHQEKRRKNIRLMMEKTNSAKTISDWAVSRLKVTEPTFSEIPDTKNIDETDKEAEYSSITSLMLMLMKYVRQQSVSSLAVETETHTSSSQKVIRMVAAVISTGIVILW